MFTETAAPQALPYICKDGAASPGQARLSRQAGRPDRISAECSRSKARFRRDRALARNKPNARPGDNNHRVAPMPTTTLSVAALRAAPLARSYPLVDEFAAHVEQYTTLVGLFDFRADRVRSDSSMAWLLKLVCSSAQVLNAARIPCAVSVRFIRCITLINDGGDSAPPL